MRHFLFMAFVFFAQGECLVARDEPILATVVGDVPRSGAIALSVGPMTIEEALASRLLELDSLRHRKIPTPGGKSPVRIILNRDGKSTEYDLVADKQFLQTNPVLVGDTIEVRDKWLLPAKIKEATRRVQKFTNLASTDLGDEIVTLSKLRHELFLWKNQDQEGQPPTLESFLDQEVARLGKENRELEIIEILKLREDTLLSNGIGPQHPSLKITRDLLERFQKALKEKPASPAAE